MNDLKNDGSTTPARQPWTAPTVQELPRLTDLTLQTFGGGIPGGGGTGGGGSTVF